VRRALTQMPLQVLRADHVAELRALLASYDEVVVVLPDAEEAFTERAPLSAGERLGLCLPILRGALPRLPYLLPVKRGGRSAAQWLGALAALCPAFDAVVCRGPEERAVLAGVLPGAAAIAPAAARPDLPVLEGIALSHLRRGRVLDGDPILAAFAAALAAQGLGPRLGWDAAPDGIAPAPPRRGLFLTRAQLFHNGHLAFVRQAAAEMDEVIVAVAHAEASHAPRDPATCGERVALIRPVLEAEAPGRYHLVGAPYEPIAATNFAELRLLAPPFTHVYTSNPTTATMAEEAGCACVPLRQPVAASGTELRRRIDRGEPWEDLVPPAVAAGLRGSPLLARMRAMAAAERR
jgi:nicotinamide-nucleotide adenylyltransferase